MDWDDKLTMGNFDLEPVGFEVINECDDPWDPCNYEDLDGDDRLLFSSCDWGDDNHV